MLLIWTGLNLWRFVKSGVWNYWRNEKSFVSAFLRLKGSSAWLSGKVFDFVIQWSWVEPHWILWVFRGSVLGQDTWDPIQVLVKPKKVMHNVSCHYDMTEISKTVFSFNHNVFYPSPKQILIFWLHIFCCLEWSKLLSYGWLVILGFNATLLWTRRN